MPSMFSLLRVTREVALPRFSNEGGSTLSIKVPENVHSKLAQLGEREQELLEKVQQGELITRNINEEH